MQRSGRQSIGRCILLLFPFSAGCGELHTAVPPGWSVTALSAKPDCLPPSQFSSSNQQASLQVTPEAEALAQAALHDPNPFSGTKELAVEVLVEQVLARNPSLAQMNAAWQAASARYPQVMSLDDPMLGTMMAPASIGSNEVEFGYRVEISQKVPFPGKRGLRGRNALAEASAAGNDLADMRLQLIENTKHVFYDYYLASRALAVNEEAQQLLKTFREKAKERYEKNAPGAAQQDMLQADVEIGRQRQRQLTLERMRQVALARLNTLMHLAPDTPVPAPPRVLQTVEVIADAGQLRSRAVAQRPDLQALADRIAADQAMLDLARKDYYPDFEVAAAYDTIMGNGPTRDLAAQVGFRLNVPIRSSRRDAALAEAQARIAQKQAELDKLTDQVNLQVQEAYEQVRESEKTVRLFRDMILPAAEKNISAAQSAYETGKIPFVSLVEAQRSRVEIQDRYYEAGAEYFRRRATLERVTGGPLETASAGDPKSP